MSDEATTDDADPNPGTWDRARSAALVLGTVVGGAALAVGAVLIAKSLGANPKLQRIAAYAGIASAMIVLVLSRRMQAVDPVTLTATLVGLSTVVVSILLYLGPIDQAPAFGCITSSGTYEATISGETAIVYKAATASSDAKRLLLQGCVVHYSHYCLGAAHHDIIEKEVVDTRWLILPHNQGYLASGFTVGTTPDIPESDCPKSVARPDSVVLHSAQLDVSTGLLRLRATAPRAAFIGFAMLHAGRWTRLGWDTSSARSTAVLLQAPTTLEPGDTVAAVACIAFRRAAGAKVVDQVSLTKAKLTGKAKRRSEQQPTRLSVTNAACDSGVLATA